MSFGYKTAKLTNTFLGKGGGPAEEHTKIFRLTRQWSLN